jgi:YD repeat-containing protein
MDKKPGTTTLIYDRDGRLIRVVDSLGGTTANAYDGRSPWNSIIDSPGTEDIDHSDWKQSSDPSSSPEDPPVDPPHIAS